MVKKKDAASNALRQAELDLKAIRARSRKLLKKANIDLREYRRQLKTLQKQNLISKRIEPAKHLPTKYMMRKLKAFKSVALGHELAIPVKQLSPHRLRDYIEKGLASIVRFGKQEIITVPKTAKKQVLGVEKGHLVTTTSIARGEEKVIKLGARIEDLQDLYTWLSDNEERLNSLYGPRAQFGFQLMGHNSKRGMANVRELIEYLNKYNGSFDEFGRYRGDIQNSTIEQLEFVLIKFRGKPGKPMHPTMTPYYGSKRYSAKRAELKGREKHAAEQWRKLKQRERQNKRRLNETPEEKEKRLTKQRERDRRRSNDRRERNMAKRLMGD